MILKNSAVRLINLYQRYLSPFKQSSCVFYPTCSTYTKEAIIKYGFFKGSWLGIRRILRCHPWQKNHIDKVP